MASGSSSSSSITWKARTRIRPASIQSFLDQCRLGNLKVDPSVILFEVSTEFVNSIHAVSEVDFKIHVRGKFFTIFEDLFCTTLGLPLDGKIVATNRDSMDETTHFLSNCFVPTKGYKISMIKDPL